MDILMQPALALLAALPYINGQEESTDCGVTSLVQTVVFLGKL